MKLYMSNTLTNIYISLRITSIFAPDSACKKAAKIVIIGSIYRSEKAFFLTLNTATVQKAATFAVTAVSQCYLSFSVRVFLCSNSCTYFCGVKCTNSTGGVYPFFIRNIFLFGHDIRA